METIAIPLLLAVGALLAVQAAANVQLSNATGSPFGASALQLGVGAALLLGAAAVAGSIDAFGLLDEAEPWHLLGGLGSAVYITSGILLFPRLGAVTTVGLWITGQMLASLALDAFGWLGVEAGDPGVADALGAAAVLLGAALLLRGQAGAGGTARVLRRRGGWAALAILAGAALPVQGAVNAQLRGDLDATVAAAAVSFLVATAAMGLVLAGAVSVARAEPPRVAPLRRVPWWGWLGGVAGAAYVTAVFSLIPEIGAAATIALTVTGQQAASVVVDRFGLLRLPRRAITTARLAAVGALLAGVVLIQLA
jgi:transporter family-2 protein